ncbi:histidine kinase N-terminal 7TM domain-containing protein [Halovenus rubra]|uniref:histidine kinase n=2 Tax=Halovenus rubra TaxID=869890 RepID=A0ABD5X7B0_9EURY|nr:histidine kinase N-terminal 7TM domain-containing protein [Halovenus rubra]
MDEKQGNSVANTLFLLYVGILLVSGILAACLGYFALTRTQMRSKRWFGVLMISLVLWSLTAAGELVLSGRTGQLAMKHLFLIVGTTIPLVWVVYTADYTYRSIRTNSVVRLAAIIYIPLILTLVTNPFYEFYAPLTPHETPFTHIEIGVGPARIVAIAYVIGNMAVGTYYLGHLFERGRSQVSRPVAILVGAVLLGLVPFLGSVFGFVPVETYDHTSLGVVVFLFGVSYVVFRHGFYHISPIARDIILEEAKDPIFVLNNNSRLVDHNTAAAEIVPDLHASGTRALFSELHTELAAVVDELEPDQKREIMLPVGEESRYFSVQISEVTVNAEKIGTVVFLRDITKRRTREKQLERQNEKLDDFAGVVSHDLRNPLNAAQLRLNLVDGGDDEHVVSAQQSLNRMEMIIEDILTLSRAGETVEDPEQIRLADVIRKGWDTVTTDGVDIKLQVTESVTIRADRARLQRVFENLFRNAVDHNRAPVKIRVGLIEDADETGGTTVSGFYVADNGGGIPEDKRDDIFDHGYSSSDEGTGFGLSIVADIVDAHDGDIGVTESDDGGARFNITGVTISS